MAERSTAAVDVAADSGDQPLTAEAQQTTSDGATRSREQETASGEPDATDTVPDASEKASSEAPDPDTEPEPGADPAPSTTDASNTTPGPGAAPASEATPDPGTAQGSGTAPDTAAAAGAPGAEETPAAQASGDADSLETTLVAPQPQPDVMPPDAATDASAVTGQQATSASGPEAAEPEAEAEPEPEAEPQTAAGPGQETTAGSAGSGAEAVAAKQPGAPAPPARDTATTKLAPVPDPVPDPAPEAVTAQPSDAPQPAPAGTSAPEPAAVPQPSRAPELHSGFRLARRYRLEECVTRLDGFSSWRAVDEKLRRAVGVHLLPADHPRARSVLAAARASALLGDPRFVQVLDAVEENDLVYVVQEWLPDATELTTLLASGPLEVHDAYQMVLQVTQAMTAAQRKDLAHLRLTPGAVLRTSTGQWRVRGLAVNAALRGITSATPQRTDTEAIGALLYAALTQRWPYENDAYGLSGLPKGVGLIAPDQVRAGVHRGLSELAMRALVNDGATASRQSPPCTTPEELLEAIGTLPKIPPPEPAFTPPPEYRRTTYQQGAYRRSVPAAGPAAPAVPPPPPLQSRAGKALKWGVSALLVVAIGLGSWQLADALLDTNNTSGKPGPSQSAGSGRGSAADGKPLKIADAQEFKPTGSGISEDEVSQAVDGKQDTAWVTPHYDGYANFGNLPNRKQGSGIIVDLGSVREVTGIDLQLYRSGQRVEVLAADSGASDPASLSDFPQRLAKLGTVGKQSRTDLAKPVTTRYVLVHVTSLSPDSTPGQYRGGISEIKIFGKPSE